MKRNLSTPGPWKYTLKNGSYISKGSILSLSKDGQKEKHCIAVVLNKDAIGDMMLISSAPNLLEAAKEALEAMDYWEGINETSDKLRAAIAKAEGRLP